MTCEGPRAAQGIGATARSFHRRLKPTAKGKSRINRMGSALPPREEQTHVPLQAAQKHPLKAGNSPPVGLPVLTRAGLLNAQIRTLMFIAVTQHHEDGPREERWRPLHVPLELQAVPNPSHGDAALVQPALGWQKIQGPESLPASHRLHSLIFPNYYSPSTTAFLFRNSSVPNGSPC